jgi:hypothetical protein
VGRVDALAAEVAADRLAEPVVPDSPDERCLVPEAGESDRDIRLGTRYEPVEGDRLRQRSRPAGDERHEALAERDELGHPALVGDGSRTKNGILRSICRWQGFGFTSSG